MAPNSEASASSMAVAASELPPPPPDRKLPQHGVNGVFYGGEWLDIEDCANKFNAEDNEASHKKNRSCKQNCSTCPRSKSCID
eukprot:13715976-Ditylum_brightwellii.AAC.1